MSSRRIARELAVILLPQLPKDKEKLSKLEMDQLVTRSVQMLADYAKQCLSDANAFVLKAQKQITETEIEHEDNATLVEDLRPVAVTTAMLAEQLQNMERALHLTAEALDVPQMLLQEHNTNFLYELVSNYLDHKEDIDRFITQAKAKWRLERMVSIDRDILRLACAEALYLTDVPVNVTINEAIELSHRFADEKAAKYINGVLGDLADVAKEYRKSGRMPELDTVSSESP